MRRALLLHLRSSLRVALPVALCWLTARQAKGSGFHIDEQDGRATGRAGAIVASTRSASAIYYNPAGLGHLEGWNLQLGASFVAPSSEFLSDTSGAVTPAETKVFPLPHAYVSYRANDLVALGLGFNAPFGLGLEWPADSPGRTIVRKAQLRTFFIMPVIAFDASEWTPGLAFGAGVDFVPAGVRLERDIAFGVDLASVALSGKAFGVGARAGISYRPPALPSWSFGASYRSPVQLDFSGDADFDASPTYRASLPPDGTATTSVQLPQTVLLGVAFSPLPEWQLELDGNWRQWSAYDTLVIELPAGEQSVTRRDWRNTITVRLGTEVTFAERWSARLGFIWDQTPVPASTLDFQFPDDNRIDLTLGFGAKLTRAMSLDVSALHVLHQERATARDNPLEPPVKGEFSISAWVFGLSLSLALDAKESDAGLAPEGVATGSPPPSDCERSPSLRAQRHVRCVQ